MWEDNAAYILMSDNPVNRDRSRHIDVKFHFLRERVRAGEIKLYKCWDRPGCLDLPFFFFPLFPAPRLLCLDTEKFDVFSFPFSTIFLSVI